MTGKTGLFLTTAMFLACTGGVADRETPGVPDSGAGDVVVEASEADVQDAAGAREAEAAMPPAWWDLPAPSGPRVGSILGVSSHMAQGPGANAERDFEIARYAELGGVHVRNDYLWQWIEPTRGGFDFAAVEKGVDAVLGSGGRVTAILDYGVGWAMPDGTPGSIEPADFAAYAGALAGHFCGRIADFEVWNEPNSGNMWPPKGDPARYGLLLKAAHQAVKAACPQARVLTGGLSPMDMVLGWQFYKDLGAAMPDVCDHFDALAIHPYTNDQAASPEYDFRMDADNYLNPGQSAMVAMARDRLKDWGCPDRPIDLTEMGWPSYTISEVDQGRWLARSLLLAARDGVEVYEWYTFWDSEPVTTGPSPTENYFGMFGWPGDLANPRREKPAWGAFRGISVVLGDARFAGDVSAALGMPNDVYALAFGRDDGTVVLAAWDGRDMPDCGIEGCDAGGAGTTWNLSLHLPAGTASAEVRDLVGAVTRAAGPVPGGTLDLVLTPSVQYVAVRKG